MPAGSTGTGQEAQRDESTRRELPLQLSTSLNSCGLLFLTFINVFYRDFWDSLVWLGSQESWEKR